MLDHLKRRSEYVFGGTSVNAMKSNVSKQRKTIAAKLQNPRILKITFHTLTHRRATQLYHQTRDLLYVMKYLGHKDCKNTLLYIDLESVCFQCSNDDYMSKVAKTEQKAGSLIESGFNYVCDFNGSKLFRKRKRNFYCLS